MHFRYNDPPKQPFRPNPRPPKTIPNSNSNLNPKPKPKKRILATSSTNQNRSDPVSLPKSPPCDKGKKPITFLETQVCTQNHLGKNPEQYEASSSHQMASRDSFTEISELNPVERPDLALIIYDPAICQKNPKSSFPNSDHQAPSESPMCLFTNPKPLSSLSPLSIIPPAITNSSSYHPSVRLSPLC